jgi:hypothetical protein
MQAIHSPYRCAQILQQIGLPWYQTYRSLHSDQATCTLYPLTHQHQHSGHIFMHHMDAAALRMVDDLLLAMQLERSPHPCAWHQLLFQPHHLLVIIGLDLAQACFPQITDTDYARLPSLFSLTPHGGHVLLAPPPATLQHTVAAKQALWQCCRRWRQYANIR